MTSAAAALAAPRFFRRPDWVELTPDTQQFTIRDSARGFKLHGKLWLAGGYMVGNVPRKDVLTSEDGIRWTMVNANAPFGAFSPMTAHAGRIVATAPKLMFSDDGVSWETVETDGEKLPLASEKPLVSFKDTLYLLDRSGTYFLRGTTWIRVATPFDNRDSFSAVVHAGRLYVMGGALRQPNKRKKEVGYDYTSRSDVWVTDDPTDPAKWQLLSPKAPWRERMWPAIIDHGEWIYLFGGYINQIAENANDTWRSRDGIAWERVPTQNLIPARHAPTLFSHDGRILVLAGNTNVGTSVQNDIWVLDA